MEDDRRQSQKATGGAVVGVARNKTLLVVLVVVLIGVVVGGLILAKPFSKKDASNNQENSSTEEPTEIRDSTTMTSEAAMFKIVLGVFKNGGNFNDMDITGRGHYPSAADVKDASWLKENMNIESDTHEMIKSGEIVYEPKGCDADKPSGEDNACSGFTLRVDGKVVAEE